jgi:hypothetical protein
LAGVIASSANMKVSVFRMGELKAPIHDSDPLQRDERVTAFGESRLNSGPAPLISARQGAGEEAHGKHSHG